MTFYIRKTRYLVNVIQSNYSENRLILKIYFEFYEFWNLKTVSIVIIMILKVFDWSFLTARQRYMLLTRRLLLIIINNILYYCIYIKMIFYSMTNREIVWEIKIRRIYYNTIYISNIYIRRAKTGGWNCPNAIPLYRGKRCTTYKTL